jgi:hypothetical protein
MLNGREYTVDYEPGESTSAAFGGNSNWRGLIWFPVNFLVMQSLLKFHEHYGDDLKAEFPTGSGRFLTLEQIAGEIGRRLSGIFLKDEEGRRPVFGNSGKFQDDPNFNGFPLFYEYFHGDNGRGLGASHQTGWTALVACILMKHGS